MEEQSYNVVSSIISSKDLDYLSDMFAWNYGAIKMANASINSVSCEEIKSVMQKAYNVFQNNLNEVLNILKEGGSNE
ncbi:MAG: hypothetical protein Q4E39_06185 [bacterium]|nr:hypothetical protein [bacterium]